MLKWGINVKVSLEWAPWLSYLAKISKVWAFQCTLCDVVAQNNSIIDMWLSSLHKFQQTVLLEGQQSTWRVQRIFHWSKSLLFSLKNSIIPHWKEKKRKRTTGSNVTFGFYNPCRKKKSVSDFWTPTLLSASSCLHSLMAFTT